MSGENVNFNSASSHLCPLNSVHKQSSKQKQNCKLNETTSSKIVVVGALSFLGSRFIPSLLVNDTNDVIAVAQDGDIIADNELLWYRKDQLLEHHGVAVKFANFSNLTQLRRTLLGDDSEKINPSMLVYIAPGVEEAEYSGEGVNISEVKSVHLKEFVMMLELFRQTSPCTKVVLVTESALLSHDSHMIPHNGHMTIKQAWMRTFEQTLSTYHSLYQLPITVFRVGGTHGPWSHTALKLHHLLNEEGHTLSTKEQSKFASRLCWYIEDVLDGLLAAMQDIHAETGCAVFDMGGCTLSQNSNLLHQSGPLESKLAINLEHVQTKEVAETRKILNTNPTLMLENAIRKSLAWAKSYLTQKMDKESTKKSVVFTSYFTSTEDSQRKRHVKPNKFQYMKEWTLSLKKLGMEAVVFHDGLDAGFQHRLSQFYSNISFEFVKSLRNRSTNDARFYAYLDYLQHHPNIDRVLLTDISDVRFQFNPFELMSLLGDWLYIGTDIDIFPSMKTMQWIHERLRGCFGSYSVDHGDLSQLMELDTVYNAGTVGGSRDMVLTALWRIVEYLNLTPTQLNCNMPAVNYAVHKHFYEKVFTAYPLNSRFLRRQASPKGVYIIHK